MRSKMLLNMSQDKKGWRPVSVSNPDTGKTHNDRCMISNGRDSKLVIVEGEDEELDSLLEKKVMKEIKDLVERDRGIMLRETLIFSAIAQASVSQAQQFVGLVQRDAKMQLTSYVNHADKIVKAIQKDAISLHGEQMEMMLKNLEEAANAVYQKFGDSLVKGNLPELMTHILSFDNTEKPKVVKMKAVKEPFPCTSCGSCCNNVQGLLDQYEDFGVKDPDHELFFPHKVYKNGKCSKLGKDNMCTIYEDRPIICNMEKMQEVTGIPEDEFRAINIKGCNDLMDRKKIDKKFRILENPNQ